MYSLTGDGISQKLIELSEISSSASEIDAVAKVIDQKLAKIHQLFRLSVYGGKTIKYIISGDSTRNNAFNKMIDYYTMQLSKANVYIYNNAFGGQTGEDWKNNTDSPSLQDAINNSIGIDGEDTILEYSFGINDYTGVKTKAEVKNIIKSGIEAYKLAKPKAIVILCQPVKTSYTLRNADLFEIYTEISNELDLILIDTYTNVTSSVQGNSLYYADSVHPNSYGSRRIVNYIISKILPIDLLSVVTIQERVILDLDNSELNYSPFVLKGTYNGSGVFTANANTRCTPLLDVEPNLELLITTTTSYGVVFYSVTGEFISYLVTASYGGGKRSVTVPAGAYRVGFNVSLDGAAYGSQIPSVKYNISEEVYLKVSTINNGLAINNLISNMSKGRLIDDYGKIGSIGELLKIDSNGKMKWSV